MPAAHISPYAGTWYPEQASELENLLEDCFARSNSRAAPQTGALGFVVPHAAPQWSGTVASSVYRTIQQQKPERIVVLAFPHRGGLHGIAAPDVPSIRTPLGELALDPQEYTRVSERQVCDHSLEIQLPFLQKAAPTAVVTGLYVGPMSAEERARAADELAALWRPGTIFLASSDFTHYGPDFGYVPFPADRKVASRLRELDFDCIHAAGSIDSALFLRTIAARNATVCGVDPIALLLDVLHRLTSGRAFQAVLDYQTSGEIGNDFRNSVSYAALGFYPRQVFDLDREDAEALLDSAERTLGCLRATGRRKPVPASGSPALAARRGVFVSLYRGEELLGCVGNAVGRECLAFDTPDLALASALDDPRFEPAGRSDGPIDIEISILTPLRRLGDPSRLCCGRDGALLEIGGRSGLLLPQVASGRGWSTDQFLSALARKSLLGPRAWLDPRAHLSVFEAQVFSRPGPRGLF
jgi:AmmeMemoRadiSam system protein B/AmmeMemoRadiSam system protein A